MSYTYTEKKRIRRDYGKIPVVASMPNLLDLQKDSYNKFLQFGQNAGTQMKGISSAFASVFPIASVSGVAELEYLSHELATPKYDVEECLSRDLTFASALKAKLRLVIYEIDEDTGNKKVKDIKEQEVYLSDVPLMTRNGTFIVNGIERVVVSQVHRSPGVFFSHDSGTSHASGKLLYNARIIPHRGSWLDLEFDHKDRMYVRIDRRRKQPATYLLRSLGLSTSEIVDMFYDKVEVRYTKGEFAIKFTPELYEGSKIVLPLINADNGEEIAAAGKRMTKRALKKLSEEGVEWIKQSIEELSGRFLFEDIINKATGEVLFEAGSEITDDMLKELKEVKLKTFNVCLIDHQNIGAYICHTLAIDKTKSPEEALMEIYRVMRPGEPPTPEAAERLFEALFFNEDRYDLSDVGRMKLNARLGFTELDDSMGMLRKEDILAVVKRLFEIKDGKDTVDDIDHLSNRRVRSVGELMENQFRIGLVRVERSIKERMASTEVATMMPQELINARPLSAAIKEFFNSSQLSQFMDQVNPLAEITHKRRISALGPGGLTRERAGFEVRDVHTSHYGRVCPIETPEGPNIGLINSLASFAKINQYGFIETPYRKVDDCVTTKAVEYMSAIEESQFVIAQANTSVDAKGKITDEMVICRKAGETIIVPREQVDYMDVSPRQIVSVAASLIPFLANDDANRALMGSNMQRQAVPLMKAEAPLVGTGMEKTVAKDSGVTVVASRDGIIDYLDGNRIVVKSTEKVKAGQSGVDIYRLAKFRRSNQNTCLNQRPIVKVGDIVKKGDILADGPSTDLGELALGRNVLVAYMPWNGYNFEDSILISERIAKDDVFTSFHINEYEVMARDTKLGAEEITRDIPNVGEEALNSLDEAGIIRIGAEVGPGDILVGKVTPKGETPTTPEEKLLRAIFGEKAADVRDTSLRLKTSSVGTVVGVRVFNRRGMDKDSRALEIEAIEIDKLSSDTMEERKVIEQDAVVRLKDVLLENVAANKVGDIKKKAKLAKDALDKLSVREIFTLKVEDEKAMEKVQAISDQLDKDLERINSRYEEKVAKIKASDDLSPGILKTVKVYVAVKRKLQSGDKMAGRHGNKGVISRVLPVEDMPFMADGTTVDLVLNPLGVPSRMNVGQILETHLGWATHHVGRKITTMLDDVKENGSKVADLRTYLEEFYEGGTDMKGLKDFTNEEILDLAENVKKGIPVSTPAFDGATTQEIENLLDKAGLEKHGQTQLYDGRTGDAFDRQVTVGYKYMIKLNHLVDEKLHARSIGPYSLVTQQPLGGKAQFGGQRFGEMEVWALQAYGASYTLQEILTIKSDDVAGRTKTYEQIVRGGDRFETGIPESFNVLVQEIQALGLSVSLKQNEEEA
ncbi:MAG: DNA-directed RNA polymerase subunit beta [Proteobacteria bacterium]|nr:DNA-directed RNA polymerase subunit beta [Pseudomonadota bacterium]